MLPKYYAVRGWDADGRSRPTPARGWGCETPPDARRFSDRLFFLREHCHETRHPRRRPGRRDRRRDHPQARAGGDDEITLVGDEPEAPYSRMAIPYLLIGKVGEAAPTCATAPTTSRACASAAARPRRCGGHRGKRTVVLDDGSSCPSTAADRHRLVARHAAHPRHRRPACTPAGPWPTRAPSWPWPSRARACCRWAPASSAASSWRRWPSRGVKLTVVEMGDRMVPRMMGPTAGGMIKRWCEAKGVQVHTGARSRPSSATHAVLKVRLSTARRWRPTSSSAPPACAPTSASWRRASAAWWAC
jgi:hypothetical protein